MSNEIHDVIMQTPPITRTMVLTSVVLFIGCSLQIINFSLLPNYWHLTFFKLHIWRPFTAFLIPIGHPLECAMDIYALYKYSRQLEEDKFNRETADYLFFMIFITTIITIFSSILNATFYMKPLLLALIYTWSQDHADTVVSFYFLNIKACFVPLLVILVSLILGGQRSMMITCTGYVAGHLYLFLDNLYPKAFGGSSLISTPQFFKRFFPSRPFNTKSGGAYSAYKPANPAKTGNSTGGTSGSGKSTGVGSSSTPSTGSSTGFGRFSLSSGPFHGKGRRLGGRPPDPGSISHSFDTPPTSQKNNNPLELKMKFTTAGLIAVAASIVAAAPEVGKSFGLITIRSGSPVQNSALSIGSDNSIEINSSNQGWVTGTFQEDGKVSLGQGKFLAVSDNNLVSASEGAVFSADDSDHLSYEGSDGFVAVSEGSIYKIKTSKASAGDKDYSVALRIFYSSGDASSSGAATSSGSAAATSVAAVPPAHNSTVPQVNGASQNGAVYGAALVGVAGALLI